MPQKSCNNLIWRKAKKNSAQKGHYFFLKISLVTLFIFFSGEILKLKPL